MIEVLVSMIILSIGLLGIAAMQTQGVRFNHDAQIRTQATVLAYDMIERMRMTRASNVNDNVALYEAGDPDVNCDLGLSTIQNDLACWYDDLTARLPGGTGSITQDTTNTNLYVIELTWFDRESNKPSTEAACTTAGRVWDGTPASCLKTQSWTVELD